MSSDVALLLTALEERVAAIESRQAVLEDERAIRELISRYGFYADCGAHDSFVDLFTNDGVIELVGGAPAGVTEPVVRWSGRMQLRQFIGALEMHMKIQGRCQHLPSLDLRTEIMGDSAFAHSSSLVLLEEAETVSVYGAGFTTWSLVKIDGRWLIRHRRRVAIGTPNLADLIAGAGSWSL